MAGAQIICRDTSVGFMLISPRLCKKDRFVGYHLIDLQLLAGLVKLDIDPPWLELP